MGQGERGAQGSCGVSVWVWVAGCVLCCAVCVVWSRSVLVAMWWLKALVMMPASSSRVSFSRPVMRMMPLGRLYMMLKSLCMPWE